MRYYFIVGEASGDMHAANLIKELKIVDNEAIIRGWGGDKMQSQGLTLVKHYRDHSFMGIGRVVKNIFKIFANFRDCKKDILEFSPDVLILVDYSGFNLRMAKWAKAQNLKVFYYISPQIWATRANRVHKIKKYVDEMLVILPFEPDFYQKYDYKVHFVGHPLLDELAKFQPNPDFLQSNKLTDKTIIALLAGSRKQEIEAILPVMLQVVREFPQFQFVIAAAPAQSLDYYQTIIDNTNRLYPNLQIVENQTYNLLAVSKLALVASGTATLETALLGVPQVVCYKTSPFLFWLVKKIIKVKYIALVNLILDKPAVCELIQADLNPQRLKIEVENLLNDGDKKAALEQNYTQLKTVLGEGGASARAANLIKNLLIKR